MSGSVEEKIADLIEPSLVSMGFELVRVQYQSGTLQIMAERLENGTLNVEECAEISNTVSALLDVNDPISGRYMLEVSSPGLDRPLTRLSDYERFADMPAKIELTEPLPGSNRRRFKGIVRGANGTQVRVEIEGEVVELPFASISQAKLEIVDDPLERQLPKKGGKAGQKPGAKAAGAKKAAAKKPDNKSGSKRRA